MSNPNNFIPNHLGPLISHSGGVNLNNNYPNLNMVPNNLYVSEYPMIYGNNMGNSNNSIPLHGYNNNLINNY